MVFLSKCVILIFIFFSLQTTQSSDTNKYLYLNFEFDYGQDGDENQSIYTLSPFSREILKDNFSEFVNERVKQNLMIEEFTKDYEFHCTDLSDGSKIMPVEIFSNLEELIEQKIVKPGLPNPLQNFIYVSHIKIIASKPVSSEHLTKDLSKEFDMHIVFQYDTNSDKKNIRLSMKAKHLYDKFLEILASTKKRLQESFEILNFKNIRYIWLAKTSFDGNETKELNDEQKIDTDLEFLLLSLILSIEKDKTYISVVQVVHEKKLKRMRQLIRKEAKAMTIERERDKKEIAKLKRKEKKTKQKIKKFEMMSNETLKQLEQKVETSIQENEEELKKMKSKLKNEEQIEDEKFGANQEKQQQMKSPAVIETKNSNQYQSNNEILSEIRDKKIDENWKKLRKQLREEIKNEFDIFISKTKNKVEQRF